MEQVPKHAWGYDWEDQEGPDYEEFEEPFEEPFPPLRQAEEVQTKPCYLQYWKPPSQKTTKM